MRQVRLAAAMLAILTVLVTILFWFIPDIDINVIASGAIAAAALIIVAPFEALDRAARERVIAACITYVAAICLALFHAASAGRASPDRCAGDVGGERAGSGRLVLQNPESPATLGVEQLFRSLADMACNKAAEMASNRKAMAAVYFR